MKKYILTCLALATVCGASARKPRTARTQESAAREAATRDSLRCAAETLLRQVDSLETALLCAARRQP